MTLTLAAWFFASTALADPGTPAVDPSVLKAPPVCETAAAIQGIQGEVNGLLTKLPAAVTRLSALSTKSEDTYVRARLYTASMVAMSQALRLQAEVLRDADACHGGGYAAQARKAEQAASDTERTLTETLEGLSEEMDDEQATHVCGLIPENTLVAHPVKRCADVAGKAKN